VPVAHTLTVIARSTAAIHIFTLLKTKFHARIFKETRTVELIFTVQLNLINFSASIGAQVVSHCTTNITTINHAVVVTGDVTMRCDTTCSNAHTLITIVESHAHHRHFLGPIYEFTSNDDGVKAHLGDGR